MTTTKKTAAPAPALVAVVLAKPHEHAGTQLQAGEQINVTADEHAWLEGQGLISGTQEKSNG